MISVNCILVISYFNDISFNFKHDLLPMNNQIDMNFMIFNIGSKLIWSNGHSLFKTDHPDLVNPIKINENNKVWPLNHVNN